MGDLKRYKVAEGHFRDWLKHGLTGCRFAAMLAAKRPVRIDYYSPLAKLDHEQIEAFIDGAASREITAVLLFPEIRTSRGIAGLLSALSRRPRWGLSRVRWPRGYRKNDSIALALDWKTKSDRVICDAMGLAQVGTMPVTRRSPYVAIVVWGGPHLNPYVKAGARVGVASAPTGLELSAHRKLMTASNARVRDLLSVPPAEDMTWLRQVAFILPKASAMQSLRQSSRTRPS